MNKKLFWFFLFISQIINQTLHSYPTPTFEWPTQAYKQVNIVIILDRENQKPTDEDPDAMQMYFNDAVIQGSVPILVSGAILKNYLDRNDTAQELKKTNHNWKKKIQEKQNLTLEQKQTAIKSIENIIEINLDKIFNYRKYEFLKSTRSDLYLFLPIACKYKDAFNLKSFNEIKKEKLIKTVNESELQKNYTREEKYFIDDWLAGIKSIFKKKKEISSEKIFEKSTKEIRTSWSEENAYWWNIILHGHGSPAAKEKQTFVQHEKQYDSQSGAIREKIQTRTSFQLGYIAGLTEEDFSELIYFLDKPDLNVFFFYYGTCYGGGYRTIKPYLEKAIQEIKPLSFTIASGATQDLPTYQKDTNYTDLLNKLNALLNYSYLTYKEATKLKQVLPTKKDPWNIILESLASSIAEEQLRSDFPLIKFAGTNVFQAIYKEPRVKTITKTLVEKHKFKIVDNKIKKEETTIKIPSTIKALLIFPNIIDVEVDIEGNELPEFASLNPVLNLHFFKKINFDNLNFENSLKTLKNKFRKYEAKTIKLFAVKEIRDNSGIKKNVLFDNKYNLYKTEEEQIKAIYSLQDQINLYFRPTVPVEEITSTEELKAAITSFQQITPLLSEMRNRTQKLLNYVFKQFEINLKKYKKLAIKQLLKQINLYMPHDPTINPNIQNIDMAYSKIIDSDAIDLSNLNIPDEIMAQLAIIILQINKLHTIKQLNLSRNKLSKLPRALTKLINLESLNLGYNKLQILPANVENLVNLKELTLSGNKETIIVPEKLKLNTLEITGNYKFMSEKDLVKRKKETTAKLLKEAEAKQKKTALNRIKDKDHLIPAEKAEKEKFKNSTGFALPLIYNALQGNFNLVNTILNNKQHLEDKLGVKLGLNEKNRFGQTALHVAIQNGDLNKIEVKKTVEALIKV